MTHVDHTRMANAIRGLAMDAVEKANPAIPACRWARPMSPPCCSRNS
jgi:transketolase